MGGVAATLVASVTTFLAVEAGNDCQIGGSTIDEAYGGEPVVSGVRKRRR